MKTIEAKRLIPSHEQILWQGKPEKKSYIMETIFNPMLPRALFFGVLELFFYIIFTTTNKSPYPTAEDYDPDSGSLLPLLLYAVVYLIPVWLYLGGVIAGVVRHKKLEYVLTDQAMYVLTVGKAGNVRRLSLTDTHYISANQGLIDKLLGVGDVQFNRSRPEIYTPRSRFKPSPYRKKQQLSNPFVFRDIKEFTKIYHLAVKQLQSAKSFTAEPHPDFGQRF